MATLSLTPPNLSSSLHFRHKHQHHRQPFSFHLRRRRRFQPIFALAGKLPTPPPPTPPGQAYQPFRPPPSPLPPKYRSLGPLERLEILRDRLGLWHEYAPLISSLSQEAFTPQSIEEITGISGVEQNRLAVASQVRDSLIASKLDEETVSFFDSDGGAELLYELRLLSAQQRVSAAKHVVEFRLDPKSALELARAMKDFPRRRGDNGWESFSASSPGDCLSFSHFRLSREALLPEERVSALEKALEAAETEQARKKIEDEIAKVTEGRHDDGDAMAERSIVPVVRLHYGEVAEASSVVMLPVCNERDGEENLAAAPGWCKAEGELGIIASEKAWEKWVVLPGWTSIMGTGERGGVAVVFDDARVMPWKMNGWAKEEPVLVVAERGRREVAEENGLYLVNENGKIRVERGEELMKREVKEAFATVVIVVRPPNEEDDQLTEEDWD